RGIAESAPVGDEKDPFRDKICPVKGGLEGPAGKVVSRENKEAGEEPDNGVSSLGGAINSATAADQSNEDGSDVSSACEDEETSDEEVPWAKGFRPLVLMRHPSAAPVGGVEEPEEVESKDDLEASLEESGLETITEDHRYFLPIGRGTDGVCPFKVGVSNVQVGVYEKQDVYRVLDGCSHPKISFPNAVADQFVVKLGNALNQDCLEEEKEKQVGETKNVNAHASI
ncbi:hypothetical protein U1Q18_003346, partial [Sarracenia purpurea var. burkii]